MPWRTIPSYEWTFDDALIWVEEHEDDWVYLVGYDPETGEERAIKSTRPAQVLYQVFEED